MEQYFQQLTQIHMLKLTCFVCTPVAVHTLDKKTIHLIYPIRKSLYEILHGPAKVELSTFQKLTILLQLAKILNTFHCLKHRQAWAHGSITPHNVFVELEP